MSIGSATSSLKTFQTRIITWGYDANTHSRSRVSYWYPYDHARTLVADLCLERRRGTQWTRYIITTIERLEQTSRRQIIFRQCKLDEAEEMFQWVLEGFEKALGSDHTSTHRTVDNLGILYGNQGKLNKAEGMYTLLHNRLPVFARCETSTPHIPGNACH
ncbi:hypothetical protein K469DRAFT_261531 [Zopfia rhizophila CBS 207.26]|uniref:Kinesin light chain n=1 Tax=Zopfia rhizophila CBS 207.26 TaxID=1314779 RepID=A0A6A6DSS7_9PEZI|nr:hypothetical protein K469DRAFT_261531 [Zopfia rhizophila CBS 207.26]